MNSLLASITASLLVSCAAPKHTKPAAPLLSEIQRAAAVSLSMACATGKGVSQWRGSGVITSEHTILTANHVAHCDSGISELWAETLDGELYSLTVELQLSDFDVAVLGSEEALPGFAFKIGPRPAIGEVVCSESAIPTRNRKCDKVRNVRAEASNRDIRLDAHVISGNSGSGLYDSKGRLIGIVTLCYSNRFGCVGGGRAASLWEHRDLL